MGHFRHKLSRLLTSNFWYVLTLKGQGIMITTLTTTFLEGGSC